MKPLQSNPDVYFRPFSYRKPVTPEGYRCEDCGAVGIRLYRDSGFLNNIYIRCLRCELKRKPDSNVSRGRVGVMMAAVPTEDGVTMWGFDCIPDDGVKWWFSLPAEHNPWRYWISDAARWLRVRLSNFRKH